MENMAEDTRPWAIIMAREPIQPQAVFDISPEIKMAICPTDE